MRRFINGFFQWHRDHRVTGIEIMHVPLLIVSALLIWELDGRPVESPLIRDMESVASPWVWIAGLAGVAITLVSSVVLGREYIQRWMLGAAASWWITATFLIWSNGLTFLSFLSACIYLFIGVSAWWRIAELAMREEATKHE